MALKTELKLIIERGATVSSDCAADGADDLETETCYVEDGCSFQLRVVVESLRQNVSWKGCVFGEGRAGKFGRLFERTIHQDKGECP